jgi:hypothetical protein
MPESISSAKLPVGIIISPGTSRTTASRLWAYLWSVEREPEQEPWHRRTGGDPDGGRRIGGPE